MVKLDFSASLKIISLEPQCCTHFFKLIQMSKYLRLYPSLESGNAYIGRMIFDPKFETQLHNGVSLMGMNPPQASLKNASKPKSDLLYALGGKLVVSEKLKAFLEMLPEQAHFEFIPVKFDKPKFPNYYVLNILNLLDAFDWERSEYVLFDELGPKGNRVIQNIQRMEIDASKTDNRQLLSMRNHEGNTFITAELAQALLENGISGLQLDPLIGHKA